MENRLATLIGIQQCMNGSSWLDEVDTLQVSRNQLYAAYKLS